MNRRPSFWWRMLVFRRIIRAISFLGRTLVLRVQGRDGGHVRNFCGYKPDDTPPFFLKKILRSVEVFFVQFSFSSWISSKWRSSSSLTAFCFLWSPSETRARSDCCLLLAVADKLDCFKNKFVWIWIYHKTVDWKGRKQKTQLSVLSSSAFFITHFTVSNLKWLKT